MAAVHFRHNLICWQGNFTKRGQSQRNSATNKSNVNQICSDFCCSLLKLVSLTFKTSKSASPTTQALCKGFVSLELKLSPKDPHVLFLHFLIKVHSDTFQFCSNAFFISSAFHFHIFHQPRSLHCLPSGSGKNTQVLTFSGTTYIISLLSSEVEVGPRGFF